ncbi:MAG: D-alanyl-D-alanine carboxypeptidase [Acetobacteraceae bacterium]|nr:MAG: D-alanyl-D-alanine carboxypeptidase [Acetobacteraceae bacterium]
MGDVVSLLGRILNAIILAFVVSTFVVTQPLQAAPFAAIVMDGRTGEVLYEKNADARLHPASLTKMMTLYIVFQEIEAGRLSLDTKVTVTKYAASQPPSRLGLKPGQKIAVRYLIRAAAIKSANDAAAALGDHIGGDHATFAKRMTRTARQLGMDNTTFKNANGLTAEGHLSTARDMNNLGRHLFYDFPQYYHIFSRRTADAGIAQVANTNTRFLDSYEGADGIKTGYTRPAGLTYVGSVNRKGFRVIDSIMNTENWQADHKALVDWAYKTYEETERYPAQTVLGTAQVAGGERNTVPYAAEQFFHVLARPGQGRSTIDFIAKGELAAPVSIGQAIGEVRVTDAEGFTQTIPVFATEAVEKAPMMAGVSPGFDGRTVIFGGALFGGFLLVRRRTRKTYARLRY